MRPTVETSRTAQCECFDCCHRQPCADERTCERCGGRTLNIGLSRDL